MTKTLVDFTEIISPEKVIHKYEIPIGGERGQFALMLPIGAKVLTVDVQHGIPYLWILHSKQDSLCDYKFKVVHTGQVLKEDDLYGWKFVGTYLLCDGDLVCHLFKT